VSCKKVAFQSPVQVVEQAIVKLSPIDKRFLYHRLEQILQPTTSPTAVQDFREKRFAKGFACPHCGANRVHRRGKYKNRWRCRCVSCRKTFNDATASPMADTHYSADTWLRYTRCMSQGLSIRRSAQVVGISVPTAFY
jgi:transposase-like protein